MDCSEPRIVEYSLYSLMKSPLAVITLRHTVKGRKSGNTIVQSPPGSQFRSNNFPNEVAKHVLRPSMGRVGAENGNVSMDSIFALLDKHDLNRQRWETREGLRFEIAYWIEATDHQRRRKVTLGKLTSIDFERIQELVATAV